MPGKGIAADQDYENRGRRPIIVSRPHQQKGPIVKPLHRLLAVLSLTAAALLATLTTAGTATADDDTVPTPTRPVAAPMDTWWG